MTVTRKIRAALPDVALSLDRKIEKIAGEPCGFVLLVWDSDNQMSYVMPAQRHGDVAAALREIISAFEDSGAPLPVETRRQ